MALVPELVVPHLRGSFGQPYIHAEVAASTQTLVGPNASHGTVALAEHQTEGRGRRGRTWVDTPGLGLSFSIVLEPPLPRERWAEITIVAARAIAAAIGDGATVKDPNDVLLHGRKVAGVLAEATDRVVLGIGVNVGAAPWPGSGAVGGERLELLVRILDRLEQGWLAWVESAESVPSP